MAHIIKEGEHKNFNLAHKTTCDCLDMVARAVLSAPKSERIEVAHFITSDLVIKTMFSFVGSSIKKERHEFFLDEALPKIKEAVLDLLQRAHEDEENQEITKTM